MTRRLVYSYLAITALVLVVLIVPLGVTNQHRQLREVQAGLERDAFVLASLVEDGLERGVVDAAAAEQVKGYAERVGARVVVVDAAGNSQVDTGALASNEREFASRPEFAAALDGRVATGKRRSATLGADLVYAAVPVASSGIVNGAVRVTYPSAEVDDRVYRYWFALAGVAAVSLLAVAGIGILIARSVTKPLREVEAAAVAIGDGDLGRRVPDDRGPTEVRKLASSFNRTAERLQELVGSQEAFVADASHQLRTPLTALRLRLENAEAESGPEVAGELQEALGEVERLGRLVDGLLLLARADRAKAARTARPLDVRELVDTRVSVWEPLADERDVRFDVTIPSGLAVHADPDRLSQVLDNLLANALDASPGGSAIRVDGAELGGERVALHVVDEGPGLSAEQRARAFDRLWRASPASNGLGGSGLGLAIVAKLVHADGGAARLDEAPGGGIDAVVELPT